MQTILRNEYINYIYYSASNGANIVWKKASYLAGGGGGLTCTAAVIALIFYCFLEFAGFDRFNSIYKFYILFFKFLHSKH